MSHSRSFTHLRECEAGGYQYLRGIRPHDGNNRPFYLSNFHLGPEHHHVQVLQQGVEAGRGHVDKHGIVQNSQRHVMENVTVCIQVQCFSDSAGSGFVDLLRKKCVEVSQAILASDLNNAVIRAIYYSAVLLQVTLLYQRTAVVPCHASLPCGLLNGFR